MSAARRCRCGNNARMMDDRCGACIEQDEAQARADELTAELWAIHHEADRMADTDRPDNVTLALVARLAAALANARDGT